jgi:CRISPR-associated protein Cmr3
MFEIKQWLRLEPLDTLFFRGSEPMLAGESHEVASRFPPMPSTLVGALATAILTQRGLLHNWTTGRLDNIQQTYPLLGEPPPNSEQPYKPGFQVAGPLLLAPVREGREECFLPPPAHWFASKEALGKADCLTVQQAELLPEEAQKLHLIGSMTNPVWIRHPAASDLESLAGRWVNPAAFEAMKTGAGELKQFRTLEKVIAGEPVLLEQKALADREDRVGIALELNRRTHRGHFYLAAHQRLAPGVSLLVGLSEPLADRYLDPVGLLQLGGENRLVRYEVLSTSPPLPQGLGPWFLALAPFPLGRMQTAGLNDRPRVSGPLLRLAGWDLRHGFHKPVTAFLPAGTVIHAGPEFTVPFGFIPL